MKSFQNPLAWLFSSSNNSSKQHKRRQSASSISHMFASAPPTATTLATPSYKSNGSKKNDRFSFNFSNNNNNNNQHAINHHLNNGSSLMPHSAATLRTPSRTTSGSSASNQRSCPGSLKRIKSMAPLSAQEATYEAMRTIDMYLIRQIARSCMDFEMEQKIELEIKLRELAVQSMLEAQNEIDVLEVEKSLLTSDQRMNYYASQLEQQRKQLSNTSLSTDSGRGSQLLKRQSPSSQFSVGSSQQSNQSPSKLSPVSGESANLSPFETTTANSTTKTNTTTTTTSRHHSRAGAYRYSTNTMTAKRRAKDKRRELLMQRITGASNINCNMVVDSRATVTISEIRIPLMWRDVDHFKGRGDYKRFAIFCLLKVDSQIYDTQLISDVDRNVTDVVFDDVIHFNHVDHNFELTLEVYSCVYLEQFSFSSTPRKLKEKLSNSVGKAMGRRLATQMVSSNFTKELQAYDKSYRFAMIASAILKLDDASHSVKTYDLVLVTPSAHHRQGYSSSIMSSNLYSANNNNNNIYNNNSQAQLATSNTKDAYKNTLPLFGHFCCTLQVRPDVFNKSYKTGYLRVATMKAAVVHWGLLRNFALHLWPVDEFALRSAILAGQPPARLDSLPRASLTLNLDKFTRLLRVSNSSLTIETPQGCFVLGAYCPEGGLLSQAEEMAHWLRSIEQPIYDSHIWGSVLGHHFPATKSVVPQSPPARHHQVAVGQQQSQQYRHPTPLKTSQQFEKFIDK